MYRRIFLKSVLLPKIMDVNRINIAASRKLCVCVNMYRPAMHHTKKMHHTEPFEFASEEIEIVYFFP